jgi:methionine-rich copper-binding protein CopC
MTVQAPQQQWGHAALTAPVVPAAGTNDAEPEPVDLPFSIAELAQMGSPETRLRPHVRAPS